MAQARFDVISVYRVVNFCVQGALQALRGSFRWLVFGFTAWIASSLSGEGLERRIVALTARKVKPRVNVARLALFELKAIAKREEINAVESQLSEYHFRIQGRSGTRGHR